MGVGGFGFFAAWDSLSARAQLQAAPEAVRWVRAIPLRDATQSPRVMEHRRGGSGGVAQPPETLLYVLHLLDEIGLQAA